MSLAAVESFFDLHARKTTVARELRGGVSTFLTKAYILFDRARHRIRDDLLRSAGGAEGRAAAVHPVMYTVAAAFAAFFASE